MNGKKSDFKGKVCYWACVAYWIAERFRSRRAGRWGRLARDLVESVRLYRKAVNGGDFTIFIYGVILELGRGMKRTKIVVNDPAMYVTERSKVGDLIDFVENTVAQDVMKKAWN